MNIHATNPIRYSAPIQAEDCFHALNAARHDVVLPHTNSGTTSVRANRANASFKTEGMRDAT